MSKNLAKLLLKDDKRVIKAYYAMDGFLIGTSYEAIRCWIRAVAHPELMAVETATDTALTLREDEVIFVTDVQTVHIPDGIRNVLDVEIEFRWNLIRQIGEIDEELRASPERVVADMCRNIVHRWEEETRIVPMDSNEIARMMCKSFCSGQPEFEANEKALRGISL